MKMKIFKKSIVCCFLLFVLPVISSGKGLEFFVIVDEVAMVDSERFLKSVILAQSLETDSDILSSYDVESFAKDFRVNRIGNTGFLLSYDGGLTQEEYEVLAKRISFYLSRFLKKQDLGREVRLFLEVHK